MLPCYFYPIFFFVSYMGIFSSASRRSQECFLKEGDLKNKVCLIAYDKTVSVGYVVGINLTKKANTTLKVMFWT